MMNFFFLGVVSNCLQKGIYTADDVKKITEPEEGVLEQAVATLEPLEKGLDDAGKKRLAYCHECLVELENLNKELEI